MTAFIDSHVHLADDAFNGEVDEVITRACASGAQAFVCIGESPTAAVRARKIVERFPAVVYHTCGVHPHDAAQWDLQRDGESIRQELTNGAVAVGECGLDYFYDNAPREQQLRVLQAQLAIAAELHKPIVLHTRDAEDDTRAFLSDAATAGVQGVLHCFTGTVGLAEAALAANWYVSFSGIITFRKWTNVDLLRAIPDNRILVESDAPYLAPTPYRGKRNEPAFVIQTLQQLAAVRDQSLDLIAGHTVLNCRTLFALPLANTAATPPRSIS